MLMRNQNCYLDWSSYFKPRLATLDLNHVLDFPLTVHCRHDNHLA